MATRKELIDAVGARYRLGSKDERSTILDEFEAITGYHRKHCIRLLSKPPASPKERNPSVRYGPAVRDALGALWEVSDRVCSKRLKVMIPALLPAMIRHGRISNDANLHAQLLAVSAATIDRLLASLRLAASKGRRRAAGQSSAVRRAVPVRTFGDWGDPAPGYLEVDFVAHCGPQLAGNFIQTLVLTDVATGWTECVPVLTRDSTLVIDAIDRARTLFPFPMRGVDFDNDSVFMNDRVVGWCTAQGLEVTRARAYRKNDQAWVEQKNGAIVRRLVGYGRFEGLEAVRALTRLYAAARIDTNVLQPSFKLRSKSRIGAKVVKRYHPPVPPASPSVGACCGQLRGQGESGARTGDGRSCRAPGRNSGRTRGLGASCRPTRRGRIECEHRRCLQGPRRGDTLSPKWRAASDPSTPLQTAQADTEEGAHARQLRRPSAQLAAATTGADGCGDSPAAARTCASRNVHRQAPANSPTCSRSMAGRRNPAVD
ncbi:DDE-type integrase/transposase/recombinase [Variovorax sp. OV329]|uniref:integrase catalytic domain-containing protein n=1 Tax=Variovorax sp. OV329 TaxID=1882825 RepID=UPI0008E9FE7E|nr:DDE-type integrase/transposase/recombinase [Variovorax sp. OV329]SFM91795.1 Integrase core domain-containing protein [Variovorax sp. OV329]